jgi:D-alanyl-D-alanine carboxypeptidase
VAFVSTLRTPAIAAALAAFIVTAPGAAHASATEAALLIEADTGKVLHAENATVPWYPASLSKLMTLYVTLQAVKDKRITLDTLFTVSPRAASQAPSKIGFKPGTQITVDNALKILMVKSANDMAVVLAEGVGGSVEGFAQQMNETSTQLGMTQSSWVNPNGLPADEQITSARDLGILARALIHDLPEYDMYWHIPAIQLGKKYMRNFNTLIGRYDGADGMKTGFICASGFNLVATATRNGKRLIAVVLGAPSSPYRAAKAAGLLERGFHRGPLSWLSPSLGTVESLQPVNTTPPDLREEMCGAHRKRPAAEEADDEATDSGMMLSNLPPGATKPSQLLKDKPDIAQAITVFVGAAKNAAEAQFAAARAKIAKLKGKKGAAPTATAAAPAAPATDATASATTRPLRTVTAPPSDKFTPPPSQPTRAARTMPGPTDGGSAMSFTSPAKAEPAPLTALPDAKPEAKPAAKAAAVAAKPKTKAKPDAKAKPEASADKPKVSGDKRAATNAAPKQQ